MMSEETNLADLLALNLHNFEDEVRNIVDKATKELSMEKTLKELDTTWAGMEFESQRHRRTGVMLLKSSKGAHRDTGGQPGRLPERLQW